MTAAGNLRRDAKLQGKKTRVSQIFPSFLSTSTLLLSSDQQPFATIGELVHLFSDVPPEWLYETVSTDEDPDNVWDGCYDIHCDYWVALVWNDMRSYRIMDNEATERWTGRWRSWNP